MNGTLGIYVSTIGESVTFETLDRLIKFTPKPYKLTVWYDACGRGVDWDFYKRILTYTDDVVLLTQNKGPGANYAFSLLYSDCDYVMTVFADCLVNEGYFDLIEQAFREIPRLATAGSDITGRAPKVVVSDYRQNPDGLQVFNRRAVDEIGGLCPSFRGYGHDLFEFHCRSMRRGWNTAMIPGIMWEGGNKHEGRGMNKNLSEEIERNTKVVEHCSRLGWGDHYPWWHSNVVSIEAPRGL